MLDTLTAKTAMRRSLRQRSSQEDLQPSVPHWLAAQLIFGVLKPMVHAARAVDEVLFPRYKYQPVEKPLFVFANARSGTTLLHHLLSLDDERFAPLKLHHSVFPAVTLQKAIEHIHHIDQRLLGSNLRKLIESTDQFFFGVWDGIHPTGLLQLEEDESIFVYTLLSPGVFFVFPFVEDLRRASWMDKLDDKTRVALERFYTSSVKRLLYARGGQKRLLNKSIWYPPRICSTLEMFPDAQFVYLVRHPYETIPSFLNFFFAAWKVFYPKMERNSQPIRQMAQLAIDYYRYAYDTLKQIPDSQKIVVEFRDLIADPVAVIHRIYANFDMSISLPFEARVKLALREQNRFKSKQKFSLEEFGVSRDFVYGQLKDLFTHFGYSP